MVEIKFTKIAEDKYIYLLNGVRDSVNKFFDSFLNDTIKMSDLNEINSEPLLYSKKIKSLYIIVSLLNGIWVVVDILAEKEYEMYCNSFK